MSETPNNYVIWGYFGTGNFGDDLILYSLQQFIPEGQEVTIICLGNKTGATFDSKNVYWARLAIFKPWRNGLSKLNVLKQIGFYLRQLKWRSRLVFGGGTQIFETRKNSFFPHLVKFAVLFFGKLFLGIQVIHLCTGITEHKQFVSRLLAQGILKRSDRFIARDENSAKVASDFVGSAYQIELASDVVYRLKDVFERFKSQKKMGGKPRVGLSLFPFFSVVNKHSQLDTSLLEAMNVFVAEFAKEHPDTTFVLLGSQIEHPLADLEYMTKTLDLTAKKVEYVDYKGDIGNTVEAIASLDFVVGMRLHFLITASLLGVPTVAIAYQDKVYQEAKALGLDDLVIQPQTCKPHTIDEKVQTLTQNYATFCQAIGTAVQRKAESVARIRI
jgi:polysaccharide pyruvyl transferase WcaK-like protein